MPSYCEVVCAHDNSYTARTGQEQMYAVCVCVLARVCEHACMLMRA